MIYYCFITLFKEKQYERTRKFKINRIETLFCRLKGVRHRSPNRCTSKHGILLDQNEIPKETSPLNLRDYHFLKQKCERQEKIIAILKSAPAPPPHHYKKDLLQLSKKALHLNRNGSDYKVFSKLQLCRLQ